VQLKRCGNGDGLLTVGAVAYTRCVAYQSSDIERVRAATNIVELLEGVTTVKKTGRTYKAICPFHQEKTPSLSIDVSQGLFHCFGCGVGGDVFKFVQMTQGLGFNESVEYLASRAGITLHRDPAAARRKGEREALVEALRIAVDFYEERLRSGPDAGKARAYLRGRGYDGAVIDRFHIGYSPEQWDELVQHLRDRKVPEKVMVGAGLAARTSRGRLRDWFRARVMFPIYDLRGDPVGFGARLLEGDGPKYLNSPETRLYQKARLLYGLNTAKAAISRSGFSVVVEGYTDVIGMHLAGFEEAVATCGTALGEEHFDLLRRFSDRVVLAFDADEAGAGAAIRGDQLETPVRLELDLRVALMPQGKDPAELVGEGELDTLRSAIEQSIPLLQFRLDRELRRFDLSEPEARARAIRSTTGLVARQPDPLVRREYARFIARKVGSEFEPILAAIERTTGGAASRPEREPARRSSGVEKAERQLLRALSLNDPRLEGLEVDTSTFGSDTNREAFDLLAGALDGLPPGKRPDLAAAIGERDDAAATLIRALLVEERPLEDPALLLRRLEKSGLDARIAEIRRKLDRTDDDTYSTLLAELIRLERTKRELE
jgi:DNA primase